VKQGQVLASVVDINTHESALVVAKEDGLIVGRAVDQVVRPGFGLLNIASDEVSFATVPRRPRNGSH
jgi:predicted deacylase